MKQHHFLATMKTCLLAAASSALLFTSCAGDGFADESFESSVRNTALSSPAVEGISIESLPDGSKTRIIWKVVEGASKYVCKVTDVSDANNIVAVLDSIVDGIEVLVPRTEDTNYQLSLLTIANESLGNTSPTEPTIVNFSSIVPGLATIPAGSDLTEWFANNPLTDDGTEDVAIDLEGSGTYTMSGPVDIGFHRIVLRSNKAGSTIEMAAGATFIIQNGLSLKNLRFDCTDNPKQLITLSNAPGEQVLKNQDVFNDAATTGFNLLNAPVILNNCMIKNLHNSVITLNSTAWAVVDFLVRNCIIQLDYASAGELFDFFKGAENKGAVKNFTVENSTIYNLQENSTNYFFRLANASNAAKAFGTGNGTSTYSWKLNNNTIIRTFTNKDFGNNVVTNSKVTNVVSNNIFYDVYRLYQFINNSHTRTTENNYMFYDVTSPQSNDTGGRKDSQGNPFTTLLTEAPFSVPTEAIDLTKPNGGLNLTPTGAAFDTQSGDPRWLSANQ